MSLLGRTYLARYRELFAAYNRLQSALIRRFVSHGGTVETWMDRLAPAFRKRHGWICEVRVPQPAVVLRQEQIRTSPTDVRKRWMQ